MLRVLSALVFLMTAAASSAATAQGCGGPAPCEAGGGLYHIELPEGAAPHPAVIYLHGWGGSGEGQMKNRGLVKALLARGYAVVAPTGQPRGGGRGGYRWNAFGTDAMRDDVTFLREIADDATNRFELDRSQMVLAGFSGGGMMTWRVACDMPESFAAYAPVSGLLWRPLPDACVGPIRMLHTHGWSDKVVPIEGRSVAGGRITQGDLFEGLDLIRRANGCRKDDPDAYEMGETIWRRIWTDCAPGSALELALHPGAHASPRGWTAMTLDWFEGLGAVQ
ncbi:MAG: alpha/beta fold hydrolase [Pseudomonadota bacterium]